jgi:hypothetical protein
MACFVACPAILFTFHFVRICPDAAEALVGKRVASAQEHQPTANADGKFIAQRSKPHTAVQSSAPAHSPSSERLGVKVRLNKGCGFFLLCCVHCT